jgi:hypothetical protein
LRFVRNRRRRLDRALDALLVTATLADGEYENEKNREKCAQTQPRLCARPTHFDTHVRAARSTKLRAISNLSATLRTVQSDLSLQRNVVVLFPWILELLVAELA